MYYPELPRDSDDAILEFIDTTREEEIPVDGMQLSSGYCAVETEEGIKRCSFTWNKDRFKDPAAWFAAMKERGIMPRFSIHSTNTDNTVTEPWMYTDKQEYIRAAICLRYKLFPYLYSLMVRAHEKGLPIMAPVFMAFQQDERTYQEGVDFYQHALKKAIR